MHKHNSKHDTHPAEPANEEIAVLAYSIFEASGRLDGHDLEHWLRAREQLSKGCSFGNNSKKDVTTGNGRAKNDAAEKVLAARAPRSRVESRFAQASIVR